MTERDTGCCDLYRGVCSERRTQRQFESEQDQESEEATAEVALADAVAYRGSSTRQTSSDRATEPRDHTVPIDTAWRRGIGMGPVWGPREPRRSTDRSDTQVVQSDQNR